MYDFISLKTGSVIEEKKRQRRKTKERQISQIRFFRYLSDSSYSVHIFCEEAQCAQSQSDHSGHTSTRKLHIRVIAETVTKEGTA